MLDERDTHSDAFSRRPDDGRWAPRMWMGCNFPGWLRLVARHRFAIQWPYLYIASVDTMTSLLNSLLGLAQRVGYGRALARMDVPKPPIFIIGHWRSGTTLLHELLALDERHAAPTTYQCFAPNHFLLTDRVFPRLLGFLMPRRRPMDDMEVGWDRPQEDEWALCNLGLPSPYLRIAFPNQPVAFPEYYELEGLDSRELHRWLRVWTGFLKGITYRVPKRLVIKSPLHTFRIPVIQQVFPDARFVYLVRDPFAMFASTVHTWKCMYRAHGLQTPRFEGLEEFVLTTGVRMFRRLEATRSLVAPDCFYELRYEDLVKGLVEEIQALYDHFGLGGFERVRPALEASLEGRADYRPNRHQLADRQRSNVADRWLPYFAKYGYTLEKATV